MKVLAKGDDPATVTAGSLAEGKPLTIAADDSLTEALQTTTEHKVRRLPVIDGHDLVGCSARPTWLRRCPPNGQANSSKPSPQG